MLFGYPLSATADNWLHDCLCEAVRNIHAAVESGKKVPRWPGVLPAAHQAILKNRTALKDRLKSYEQAIRKLDATARGNVLDALESQNRIPDLLSGACECTTVDALPENVRDHIRALFDYGFEALTDKVRDKHFAAIHAAVPAPVCPFCGVERFEAPAGARPDLDHYLAKSRYPFAAANLRNLVPMGGTCNSRYKLAKDLLRREDATRRVAFDPYNHQGVTVSLDESDPFDGTTPDTPRWQIRFSPESAAVPTWDEVFAIRERYRRDHLDRGFKLWLELFRSVARQTMAMGSSDANLLEALRRHEEYHAFGGWEDRAFLKAAVFRMLRRHCEAGDKRLLQVLRDLVQPPTPVLGSATPAASAAGNAP